MKVWKRQEGSERGGTRREKGWAVKQEAKIQVAKGDK